MALGEEIKESLKVQITASVKEAFDRNLSEAEESEEETSVNEEGNESEDEGAEEDSEDEDPDGDSEVAEGDDKSEDSDEDESITEAMKVQAMKVGGRSRRDVEEIRINRHADLLKLAKSKKYEHFLVTKSNGEELEYHVDYTNNRPELVEM